MSQALAADLAAHWKMNEAAGVTTLAPEVGAISITLKNGAMSGTSAVAGTGITMTGGAGQLVDSKTLIPETNDFGFFMWIAFTNVAIQTSQMHLFSCNSGQVGRCNFMITDAGDRLGWFHSGGKGLTGSVLVNDGAWHHVGLTRRGGRSQLWVDGVPDGAPTAVDATPISQAQDWRIGAFVSELAGLYHGRMDDLRVYHGALTDEEIASLTASYVPDQAEHRWRLDEAAGTTLFAPEDGWMSAVAKKAPATGLRAPQGTGIGLDGQNVLRIPASKRLFPATNDFSVFLWVRDDAATVATAQLLSNNALGSSQTNRCSFGLNFNTTTSAGKLFFFHPDATLTGTNVIKDLGWHHVGLVRRGNRMELWADGEVDAVRTYTEPFVLSQAQDWRVGANASETTDFFKGRIDDLRVYTNALTAAEIATLYDSYTPVNSLIAHWTFGDAANKQILEPTVGWREIWATNSLQSGAAGADGTGLWANGTSRGRILGSKKLIPATNDFTVLLWMRTTNTTSPEKHLFTNNRGQAGRCNLSQDATPGKMTWWVNNTYGLVSVSAGTGPAVDDGVWHQVGISRNGKTFRLWVDGGIVSSATSAAANPAVTQANDWFIASNASDAGAAFYGAVGTGYALMDDLRVYNYGLDATAVANLYSAFTPLPTGTPFAPETDHSAIEAATGGTVVGHLPAISGESDFNLPSLIVCGDGSYRVSATVLNSPLGPHAKIFRSTDQGGTWAQISEVAPLYGGTLFESGGALHLIGNSTDGGTVLIRRSTDGGVTWTAPTSGASGILTTNTGWHFRACAVTAHDSRVWTYAERRGNSARGAYPSNVEAGAMSAAQGADLLNAANWTFTEPLTPIPEGWNTSSNFVGWTNGRTVVDKHGRLRVAMQVSANGGAECLALLAEGAVSGALTHVPFTDMALLPGSANAFGVRYDPASRRFWALTNPDNVTRVGLFSSFTLCDWTFHALALEAQEGQAQTFSVPDVQIDGNDLISVYRTSYADQDGAPTARNHLLFKRIVKFRQLPADKEAGRLLVADTGNGCVRRYSYGSEYGWLFDDGADPLFAKGVYAGQALTAPWGLALANGRVYVSEHVAGGRVLAFTPRGAFQGVVCTFGAESLPGALTAGEGILFVSDEAADQIWRVDPTTGLATVWLAKAGTGYALEELRGLACDDAGYLYAADRTMDAILRFNAAGEFVSLVTQDAPEALMWDAEAGRLLATVYLTPDIVSIDPATGTVTKALDNLTGNQRFCGLAKVNGRLYFTSDGNRVNWQDGTGYKAADLRVSTPGQLLLVPQGGDVYSEIQLGTTYMLR